MRKRLPKKLHLTSETLRRLDPAGVRSAVGGQEYQCSPTEDNSSAGFSHGGPGYCGTGSYSGHSECP